MNPTNTLILSLFVTAALATVTNKAHDDSVHAYQISYGESISYQEAEYGMYHPSDTIGMAEARRRYYKVRYEQLGENKDYSLNKKTIHHAKR